MGPKKDVRKGAQKNENGPVMYNIEDPINTDAWSCVIVMAVEKTLSDGFILNEFVRESLNRRRQQVCVIDFHTLVMDVVNQFANGELLHKYAFLLNFSSIFQEAVNYVTQKIEIPVIVLVKVVKALLFYLRDESLKKIKISEVGVSDPIKAMAERGVNVIPVETKKMEISKKGESRVKVRPPSVTKENTQLLKRGEGAKYDQRIDDAPRNSCFKLYVLLTGFYNPDFPLELIKGGIPLHSLICIDTTLLSVKEDSFSLLLKFQKQGSEVKSQEIINFWTVFLKMLWDAEITFYFKNTIFQVYMPPPNFLCNKKKFAEIIYREISYLLYDISDIKRQLTNYLDHLNLWDVALKETVAFEVPLEIDTLPAECVSVPVMLQYVMNAICAEEEAQKTPSKIQSSKTSELGEVEDVNSSDSPKIGLCGLNKSLSKELEERGDFHLLQLCLKTKELDVKYELCDNDDVDSNEDESDEAMCNFQFKECGENMKEALETSDGIFRSYWKKYQMPMETIFVIDYCLYSLLMTKVSCSYQNISAINTSPIMSSSADQKSYSFEDFSNHILKTRFTITEGSRSIIYSIPFNKKSVSRDYFCPREFQIVSSEKLKACSAPVFRVTPGIQVQHLYKSEVFQCEIFKNPLKNLKGILDENLFSNTNGFHFVEILNKRKLLMKEDEHWNAYNCIDHAYSFLDDSILFLLHNRKDDQGINHETFNAGLKSAVGLRDFYDYVMEEESEWFRNQEELRDISVFLANTIIRSDSFRYTSDSEFWLLESLKHQYSYESQKNKRPELNNEIKTEPSVTDKEERIKLNNLKKRLKEEEFQGYDVSEMAVQFSGLKTIYYSNDCYVAVQLVERLYGNQDLGVHVTAASNTLHLYSYVCPKPHILDPFTFHVTYKNGIIVAFGRRFVELVEKVEETIEQHPSRTTLKGKKNSSESAEPVAVKEVTRTVKDEAYLYDMAASFPNGLSIRTVRKIVDPCYIKQHYLVKNEGAAKMENSRLFLPNGNVVKMMANDTIEILKMDTSIVTANLSDLIYSTESENPTLETFAVISGEGLDQVFEGGSLISSNRIQIFQNTDLETNQVYFRRRDGTNYMMQKDGTLCVQFKDGTRMSSTLLDEIPETEETNSYKSYDSVMGDEIPPEDDFDDSFVFVHFEVTAEHPDYATVIYNTLLKKWKILLPYSSAITVEPNGCYSVDIDKQTELTVQSNVVKMERFSPNRELLSTFTADLSVFENSGITTYCQVKDTTGKIFTLDSDSNYHVETPTEVDQTSKISSKEICELELTKSQLVASSDLKTDSPTQIKRVNKLSRENKYFVVKRNMTGMEILHGDDVNRELMEGGKGSLLYTLNIPETECRCFVLITPQPKKSLKKWEVEKILPDPKYNANPKPKTTSSTYGVPPSWMHPFPKKKTKFTVPSPLSCRVFVETKRTDLSPQVGQIDNFFCEIEEITQMKYSIITPEDTEEFLKKLSNDDQDMLKEMYTLSMSSHINEKKRLKPVNSEKLKHYLEMSKYYVELREYHKNCIRYNIVPDYFHHPAGMSWLILNNLLFKVTYLSKEPEEEILAKKAIIFDETLPSSGVSEFSYNEIEYNLSISAGQSFSDLSYRSNLSAQTAPAVMKTEGICRCKVKGIYHPNSSPAIKLRSPKETLSGEMEVPERVCGFKEKDIEKIEREDYGVKKTLRVSLEDLMYLGLV